MLFHFTFTFNFTFTFRLPTGLEDAQLWVLLAGRLLLTSASLLPLPFTIPFPLPLGLEAAQLGVVLAGRLLLTSAFGILYFWTPELFPTEVRNSVLGGASTIGRISGMVAAFIGGPLVSPPTFTLY
jgi:hypothetical protein